MIDKIFKALFVREKRGGLVTVSCKCRKVTEETLKKIPQSCSGIYKDFREREAFYKKIFISCNQL